MTLLLVDGANVLMRCAFGGDIAPDTSTPTAIGMIDRACRELKATHLVIAMDSPNVPTWRKLEYSEYKAHRTRDTGPWLEAGAHAFNDRGWLWTRVDGFEADDIIATIALRTAERSPTKPIVVLSGDSDLFALTANSAITIARPQSGGDFQIMNATDVCEKFQLPAAHTLFDYKAKVGETGDNIPGVPGIGAKKASGMLHKFGSLEEIIHAGAGGYNKDTARVAEYAATARKALRLVSLRPDVPVQLIQPSRCAVRARNAA